MKMVISDRMTGDLVTVTVPLVFLVLGWLISSGGFAGLSIVGVGLILMGVGV